MSHIARRLACAQRRHSDRGGSQSQSQHNRGAQHRRPCADALAQQRERGPGDVVPGSGGRHFYGQAAAGPSQSRRQITDQLAGQRRLDAFRRPPRAHHGRWQVVFSEGLYMGYRWYGQQNITPLFPSATACLTRSLPTRAWRSGRTKTAGTTSSPALLPRSRPMSRRAFLATPLRMPTVYLGLDKVS